MSTPYIALYPSDYLADTAHLGLTEHGVYWRMLLHYYQHCKPFPNDLEKINRVILAATPEEKRVTEYILGEFFTLQRHDDGLSYWHHARADWEISAAEARHLSAVERGKKGGRPRKKAELNLSFTSAKAEPKQPEPEPEPEKRKKTKPFAQDKPAAPGVAIWDSYRTAYAQRYSVDPVRNAKVNSQLKQLSERLGEDAPAVASFYLTHKGELYVRSLHTTDLLLRDAEKLHTEWKTNRQMSSKFARKADQSIGQGDAYANAVLMLKGGQ